MEQVMLARALSDVEEERGQHAAAARWAEKALASMQGVVGMKAHPLLQPFFDAIIDLKKKAGGRGWELGWWGKGELLMFMCWCSWC